MFLFNLFNSFKSRQQALWSLHWPRRQHQKKRHDSNVHECTNASWLQRNFINRLTRTVPTASVCTRGHDPDAEPNCFSNMFLLGLLRCSDCEVTLGSLRGGARKNVNPITRRKYLPFYNNRKTPSRRKARWTHQAIHKNSGASITLRQHT